MNGLHNNNGTMMMDDGHGHLMISHDEALRSISASPQPPQSPGSYIQEDPNYEGEESNFGKAKKSKRKAAPRTSRACLACRRQKMRCEGADDPPCKRCITNEVDCMFERRSDYLLNPEDRAWQNGVEKRLEHLGKAIDQILAHLSGAPPTIMPAPATAAPAFQEMPQTAFYDHHYDRGMVPQTAPISSDVAGRVNYVVPSPAETAAIAAQSRFKRPRGNTVPANLATGSYTPDTAFQLFSPRTAALESANSSIGTLYQMHGGQQQQQQMVQHQQMETPQMHHQQLHQQATPQTTPQQLQQHQQQQQSQQHQQQMQQQQQQQHAQQAPYSHSHSYSLDAYSGSNGNSAHDFPGGAAVPRSMASPTVRYAHSPAVPILQPPPVPASSVSPAPQHTPMPSEQMLPETEQQQVQ